MGVIAGRGGTGGICASCGRPWPCPQVDGVLAIHQAGPAQADGRVDTTDEAAWVDAEVIRHKRWGDDIAVMSLQPRRPMWFVPGQSVPVESPLRPGVWRFYSLANAPRPGGTVNLHVRRIEGGKVSPVLVERTAVGHVVRLGPPMGTRLTLAGCEGRDLLLIAGGTGLAPFKALFEQMIQEHEAGGPTREVRLAFGVRRWWEMYDVEDLTQRSLHLKWLNVQLALSEDWPRTSEHGTAVKLALRQAPWVRPLHDPEVFVCGSPGMVRGTVKHLRLAGFPVGRIRTEDLPAVPPGMTANSPEDLAS